MVQGGDPTGTGKGGKSIYATPNGAGQAGWQGPFVAAGAGGGRAAAAVGCGAPTLASLPPVLPQASSQTSWPTT